MYRVQTKTLDQLRAYYREDRPVADDWTSSGVTGYYDTVPFEALLEHFLNEHAPATWALVSASIDNGRVRLVWRDSDAR